MNEVKAVTTAERKEETLERLRNAIKDAKHVFTTYKDSLPEEAWETIRKIIFDPKLK
jgi:homoserine dehydrogenase